MQHAQARNSPIPPYGSAEYINGSNEAFLPYGVDATNRQVNPAGYNQESERYMQPDDGARPAPMQPRGRHPAHSESMMVQPSTSRPPSEYSESALPYLRSDPPPPLPRAASGLRREAPPPPLPAASGRPQSSPFPRFVPPPPMQQQQQHSSAPTTPGSMYPPVDYHSQALAVVGAHPSTTPQREKPQPAFFPAMMRPHNSAPVRGSMPVEAVMARYGQALPDEPPLPAPAFTRTESNPIPQRQGPAHNKLSRHHTRRTQSDIPQPPPPSFPQPVPSMPLQQPPAEEKKRPGSLLRKLTKKRPASLPTNPKGNADSNAKGYQPEPPSRTEILPDVLFHVRATQDYEMQSYDELSFSNRSIIAVTSAPETGRWTGYVVDSMGSRQEGIFYRTFVFMLQRMDSSRARGNILFLAEAVYSYRASRDDEFDFSAGDTIAVYSTPQGPFWIGVNERSLSSSRTKFFPWKLVVPK